MNKNYKRIAKTSFLFQFLWHTSCSLIIVSKIEVYHETNNINSDIYFKHRRNRNESQTAIC